jgi:phosphoribosylglycinamide formyltransferase 1
MNPPLRLAVLISGGGRTLRNLLQLQQAGELPIEIALVVSSSAKAGGLAFAREASVPEFIAERRAYDTVEAYSQAIFDACRAARVDNVVMAGWLKFVLIPEDFTLRVVNIHPSLLPRHGGQGMYGHHVHEAVLAAGDSESGCTVHFVDNEYDHGPHLLQRRVPVLPGDTPDSLAARVFEAECQAYPEALRRLAAGGSDVR